MHIYVSKHIHTHNFMDTPGNMHVGIEANILYVLGTRTLFLDGDFALPNAHLLAATGDMRSQL